MNIVRAKYRSGSDFLAHYQADLPHGGIFFATRDGAEPGTPVVVEIRCPELADRALVRGNVAWRRSARRVKEEPGVRLRAGIGIAFDADERPTVDWILSAVNGQAQVVTQRNYRRLPISLPIEWRVKEDRSLHEAVLDDICAGGAFIRTPVMQPEGTPLVLDVIPPGSQAPLSIEGRVAWVKLTPGVEGLGIAFRCRDTGGLRRLKELVRRLAADESSDTN